MRKKEFHGFYIDVTQFSAVAVCLDYHCDWRALTTSRLHAWELAAEHEIEVHPGNGYAVQALFKLKKRRAALERPLAALK